MDSEKKSSKRARALAWLDQMPKPTSSVLLSANRAAARRAGSPAAGGARAVAACQHCERAAVAKGLCGTHLKRLERGQPLDAPLQRRTAGGVPLSVRVSPEVHARLVERAKRERTTVSEIARLVIEAGL